MAVADLDHVFGFQDDEYSLDTDPPESPLIRRVVPLPRRFADSDGLERRQASLDRLGSAYTSSMAQHPYYLPLFSGAGSAGAAMAAAAELLEDATLDDITALADIDARHVVDADAIEGLPPCTSPFVFGQDGGVYMDQYTHPGNTKKRKVPVTAHGRASSGGGGGDCDSDSDDILPSEELADRSFLTDRIITANSQYYPGNVLFSQRRHISRATKANLQMKEMLKSRRRQLAPVLGLLLQNDSLALDHSLATLTAFYKRARDENGDVTLFATHPSQREEKRKARAQAAAAKRCPLSETTNVLHVPDDAFSFVHDSPTSRRHKATNEEVAILQKRFNAEISRQTIKAAEAAKEAAVVVSQLQKAAKRSGERVHELQQQVAAQQQQQQQAQQLPSRTHSQVRAGTRSGAQTPTMPEKAAAHSKSKAKKKKRSAMANASNPHHLRNYVPSRLPNAGGGSGAHAQTGAHGQNQNSLGPFPLRFLSAGIASKYGGGVSLTNPEEEWMCAFCEYSLFYGSEQEYRRAIRQRKKILTRRRRAVERAAAAAAGKRKGVTAADHVDEDEEDLEEEDEEEEFEYGIGEASEVLRNAVGAEQDRDRDKAALALDGGGDGGLS